MAYAVAIECFHSASLILDDLPAQDNADMRRGKPTAHLAYGEAIAQLAVVELIALGFSLIGRPTNAPGHHGGRLVEEAHRCLAGPEGLCQGQLRDLGTQGRGLATDDWVAIARAKTGQPLLFCILVPIIASGASREVEALSEMGLDLGVLFQVRDDLADRPNAQRTEQLKKVAANARKRCADWAAPPGEPWDAVHRFLVSLAKEMHDQIDRYCTPDEDNVAASLDQPLWG
jgi:geranylgeranyl pyrophosphate synthase